MDITTLDDMKPELRRAVDENLVVEMMYHDGMRLVEPYMLGTSTRTDPKTHETTEHEAMMALQIEGYSSHRLGAGGNVGIEGFIPDGPSVGKPAPFTPDFRTFFLDEVRALRVLRTTFQRVPHDQDRLFARLGFRPRVETV